jgi:ribonuclease E
MRTASSAGLSALRMIEDEAARGRGEKILLRAGREAAIYLLNKKRSELAEIEARYGVSIEVAIDEGLEGARMSVESSGPRPTAPQRRPEPTPIEEDLEEVEALLGDEADEDEDEEEEQEERETSRSQEDRPGRRRRRRRRGGRGRGRREGGEGAEGADEAGVEPAAEGEEPRAPEHAVEEEAAPAGDKKRRRRRGKRSESAVDVSTEEAELAPEGSPMAETPTAEEPPIAEVEAPAEPQPKARKSRAKKDDATAEAVVAPTAAEEKAEAKPAKPARKSRAKKATAEATAPMPEAAAKTADNDEADDESGDGPRRGWWQRTFG